MALTVLIALASASVWSYGRMAAARNADSLSRDSLNHCTRLAGQIRELSSQQAVATAQEPQAVMLAEAVESAARAVNLPAQSLVGIRPEPARRLAEGPYKEKPTRLELRGLELGQLIGLLNTLGDSQPGLRVRSLRLYEPRSGSNPDLWDADVELTALVYDPLQTPGPSSQDRP